LTILFSNSVEAVFLLIQYSRVAILGLPILLEIA
jgi:hypothetical protein